MKSTSKPVAFTLTILVLAASTFAQQPTPRELFQAAMVAFQKSATEDNARKLAELTKQLDPPPAVPEDAEFRAMKGAAFVKQAGDAAAFAKAAGEFSAAIAAAPWVGEYHYNLAVCEKSAGNFPASLVAVKLARIFARNDQERHDALALQAEIETGQELATAKKKAEEQAAFALEMKRRDDARRAAIASAMGKLTDASWKIYMAGKRGPERDRGLNAAEYPNPKFWSFTQSGPIFTRATDTQWGRDRFAKAHPDVYPLDEIIVCSTGLEFGGAGPKEVIWLWGVVHGAELKDIKWYCQTRDGTVSWPWVQWANDWTQFIFSTDRGNDPKQHYHYMQIDRE